MNCFVWGLVYNGHFRYKKSGISRQEFRPKLILNINAWYTAIIGFLTSYQISWWNDCINPTYCKRSLTIDRFPYCLTYNQYIRVYFKSILVRRHLWSTADYREQLTGWICFSRKKSKFSLIFFHFNFLIFWSFSNFWNFLNFQSWSQLSFDMLWTCSSMLPFPIIPI